MSNATKSHSAINIEDVALVSPALAKYTREAIVNGVWKRTELSLHDRSVVTVSALIARNQTIGMQHYFNKALDSGLKPSELSEIITHMAFYAGWPNAFSAVDIAKDIFAQRGIAIDSLPTISPKLLPIEEAVPDDAIRIAFTEQNFTQVIPELARITNDLLYHQVWLRPGLAPRDRNLATISALMASGQTDFLPFYLNRAVLKGVTQTQISEIIAHLAFYAGWPIVLSSVAVVKNFFDSIHK